MARYENQAFDDNVSLVKQASLEQQRGELEVRLGQARLEGDFIKVYEIEAQLANIYAELKPQTSIKLEYPSPLNEAAFHGLAGEIVKAIEPHSEADSVALLINLLTAFGNVIGSHPPDRILHKPHPRSPVA